MNSNLLKQEVASGKKILSLELTNNQELDIIAVKALVNDCPRNIVPISYYEINEKVVLKYDCHSLLDFKYLPAKFTLNEYLHLLGGLTSFLIECHDWFLNYQSFCFNPNYIFFEKGDFTLKLVYLPLKNKIAPVNQLQDLYLALVKNYQVEDGDRLQYELLKEVIEPSFVLNNISNIISRFKQQKQENLVKTILEPIDDPLVSLHHNSVAKKNEETSSEVNLDKPDTSYDETVNTENIYEMLKKSSNNKGVKPTKKKGNRQKKPGLWQKLLSNKKHKAQHINENIVNDRIEIDLFQKSRLKNNGISLDHLNETEVFETHNNAKYYLKLLNSNGYNNLPSEINIELNNTFTIGRQDYQRGESSSFEFDSTIKSISRIHARIDKENDQLLIVDLHSSNGTFVNNIKLVPNIPVHIKEKDVIKLSPKVIYTLLVRK